jgi:hypothetical protein
VERLREFSLAFVFRPALGAAGRALFAFGLMLAGASASAAGEESSLVIAPTPVDWSAALARLPARSLERIHQGLPFAIDLASPDNGAVYELRSAPQPQRAVRGWKVDLPSIVAYYNGLCVPHAALHLRLVRALTFGQSLQTGGQLTHSFEGFATGARGVNLRWHTTAQRLAEANQAFAHAFLLAVLRLNLAE